MFTPVSEEILREITIKRIEQLKKECPIDLGDGWFRNQNRIFKPADPSNLIKINFIDPYGEDSFGYIVGELYRTVYRREKLPSQYPGQKRRYQDVRVPEVELLCEVAALTDKRGFSETKIGYNIGQGFFKEHVKKATFDKPYKLSKAPQGTIENIPLF